MRASFRLRIGRPSVKPPTWSQSCFPPHCVSRQWAQLNKSGITESSKPSARQQAICNIFCSPDKSSRSESIARSLRQRLVKQWCWPLISGRQHAFLALLEISFDEKKYSWSCNGVRIFAVRLFAVFAFASCRGAIGSGLHEHNVRE